ncbi:MAG: [FeFe] hydrogenase H-cluster radical SAM maturase HydE [Elusimicrobia bacterium]|nr:[FeFe] hydrogenase H-cluster radical SAM maturase HydE [Elusimicrobiota bacterium]
MDRSAIVAALSDDDPDQLKQLRCRAYEVKVRHFGRTVHLRGLIEFSNRCVKSCFYCGIRRDNSAVDRFSMTVDEIVQCALNSHRLGYGSVVLQSGERRDSDFVAFVDEAVRAVLKASGGELGVTLSCGEQSTDTYARWRAAGAKRYLLRIETSDPRLYAALHPADHSFADRVRCLWELKTIGYQVGTGVMIGLPGQTAEQLADDILFFGELDVDMIGMGPYIPHGETPLAASAVNFDKARNFQLGLKMIALTRLALGDVNIAAATALQALDPSGREKGVRFGANIIMPNVTPTVHRQRYQLYEGKPCLTDEPDACGNCLDARLRAVGERVALNEQGDSPHFVRRTEKT